MTQTLIDKLGLISFIAMSMLILMCIGIGFFAVFIQYNNMCGV